MTFKQEEPFEERVSKAKTDLVRPTDTGLPDQDRSTLAIAERRCEARWKIFENRRRAEKEHADDLDKLKAKMFGELESEAVKTQLPSSAI